MRWLAIETSVFQRNAGGGSIGDFSRANGFEDGAGRSPGSPRGHSGCPGKIAAAKKKAGGPESRGAGFQARSRVYCGEVVDFVVVVVVVIFRTTSGPLELVRVVWIV